jgi:hypothetical protein
MPGFKGTVDLKKFQFFPSMKEKYDSQDFFMFVEKL